jgi:hypothetical protein
MPLHVDNSKINIYKLYLNTVIFTKIIIKFIVKIK